MNPILIKSYLAEAAIAAGRIVKFGTADGQVLQAAAVGDLSIGIAEQLAASINEQVDVVQAGIAWLELGGTVARGAAVTSDGTGRGLAAAPAGGVNNRCIGFAQVSGAIGDSVPVLISPHTLQG